MLGKLRETLLLGQTIHNFAIAGCYLVPTFLDQYIAEGSKKWTQKFAKKEGIVE
jgi:hypothetical protein